MLKFNFYHNRKDNFYSNKVERETTGLIGYIRGDFGSGGNSFHHSWFENKGNPKTKLNLFIIIIHQSGCLSKVQSILFDTV